MNKKFGILIIILLIAFVAFTSFKASRPSLKKMTIMIQKGANYASEWKEVAEFDKNKLPKSALEVVNKIFIKAKKANNGEQIIKALLYKASYEQVLQENSFNTSLDLFKAEAEKAKSPNKNIIYSIIAKQYWSYYQSNRWQIQNRTHTDGLDEKDIKTWDIRKIIEEASKYYLLSIENIDNLSRTPLNAYTEIITNGKDNKQKSTEKYRPFLYDFLAHRALEFFSGEEPNITKAKETFQVDNEKFYSTGKEFSKFEIEIKDSSNLKNYAIILLQKLTKTHLYDQDKTALIDVELKRLDFVKNNSILLDNETLYFESLQNMLTEYKDQAAVTEIAYKIALVHFNNGSKYSPNKSIEENKLYKAEKQKAQEVCAEVVKYKFNNYGTQQCQNLLDKINEKQLSIQTEKFVIPNTPIKSLLTYKNINKAYFRIVKVDFDTYVSWINKRNHNSDHNQYLKDKLMSLSPIQAWHTNLETDNDFNTHTTEVKIDALAKGHFVLLASDNESFKHNKGSFQYSSISSTNISYLSRNLQQGTKEFFVTHRATGNPLEKVKAEVFMETYDYKTRKNITNKKATLYTNKNGSFKLKHTDIKNDRNNYNFYVIFSKDDDTMNSKDRHYLYNRNQQKSKSFTRTNLFTDRAIYRPGQTIYFKGIVIEKDGNESSLKTNYKTTIEFLDVNWQKIKSVELTSNEFGSFSGSFVAPDDRLNGMMHIRNGNNGQISISVEEYKRPNFEVAISPITGTYKLDENVNVKGSAKTFSGAPLDGADVTYRVVRNGIFPHWCWYRWGYMPTSPEVEITNGTAKTDDKGNFEINFFALSDKTVNNKFEPTFTYTVYVDVIDVNGETHSANSYVSVSEKALLLSTNLQGSILKKDFKNITINSTNLNGVFEASDVSVEIWDLEELNQFFVERKWSAPEKHSLSEKEFKKLFPLETYANEDHVRNWKKKTKVFDQTINTGKIKEIPIDFNVKQQSYFIYLTATDKYGKKVEEMKYFRVIDNESRQSNPNLFFELTDVKTTCQPGENAEFVLSTADKNVKVYYEIERTQQIEKSEWITLNNEQKTIKIPVKEADRGNFSVHIFGVKHNRKFSYTKTISVPYENKKLDIEFSTFRDKLLPGQDEEWEIKIKGPKGEKVVAEMMAGMYDASLDEFRTNSWSLNDIWRNYYTTIRWDNNQNFSTENARNISLNWNSYAKMPYRTYASLNNFGYRYNAFGGRQMYRSDQPMMSRSLADGIEAEVFTPSASRSVEAVEMDEAPMEKEMGISEDKLANGNTTGGSNTDSKDKSLGSVKARTNFNETAFFFPHLTTDKKGNISIKFTIPESLTKWKFMALAHTTDLKTGTLIKETVTQKDLMVYPNAPRFFRENDEMVFSTKIVNISTKDISGDAKVFFFDALTNKDITKEVLKASNDILAFTLKAESSTTVKWHIKVPENYSAITYKVVAKAGNFSDGEEKPVPVLTNRMLVTETLPLPISGNQSKTFTFNKLKNNTSTTLKNHKLTLEFTSNPAWYAVQALPYLMDYPYDCAEQTFSRYYANAIATNVANSSPKIKEVFKSWENSSPEAFLSNLEKNQELKAVILEETPWVLQAQNESERKKRVGLLFNFNKMSKELNKELNKLQKMQKPSGGWPWFEGMRESRYITQHIATGLGHLDKLGVKEVRDDSKTYTMVKNAIKFLDAEILSDYQNLLKYNADLTKDHVGNLQIQYLYARSFFPEIAIKNEVAYKYYFKQAKKYWVNKSQYMQAMISLTMNRTAETAVAKDIIKSIKEYSIESEEMGMYWKQNAGYYWYQAPIETQALFIEAFAEVTNDQESIESMKVWLLKQKQTQDWKTTKATTKACYALLLQGSDWLANDDMVEIQIGNEVIDAKNNPDIKVEAGTGYFKTSWSAEDIKPEMATVKVTKKDNGVSWGAMYWQYFEQLDKITTAKTPLSLDKKLFLVSNSEKGEVITPITEKSTLQVGDKVRVRVILKTDRDMEYVHLKDMRASGFEPTNVFSGYRYQDGLGYYETTKDASTNFFIGWLSKGTYVFEYDLRANIEGNFSNGISSIQCMYAPEFASHSEGVRVSILSK